MKNRRLDPTTAAATLLLLLLCAPSGCVGTDVGNPQDGSTSVQVDYVAFDESHPQALSLGSDVELEEAWFSFSTVALYRGADCARAETEDGGGYRVVNLLDVENRRGPLLRLKKQDYCRVDAVLAPAPRQALPASAPREMIDHSILLRGTWKGRTPFVLRLESEHVFELLSTTDAFGLEPRRNSLFIALAVNGWLRQIPFDEQPEGELLEIDVERHPEWVDAFEYDLKRSARLFRDGNHDARLSAQESWDVLASSAQGLDPQRGDEQGPNERSFELRLSRALETLEVDEEVGLALFDGSKRVELDSLEFRVEERGGRAEIEPSGVLRGVEPGEIRVSAWLSGREVAARDLSVDFVIEELALGDEHACLRTRTGQVYCWGDNSSGQLGVGQVISVAARPIHVEALPEPIVELVARAEHTCALGESGQAFCWGENKDGTLGDGTHIDRFAPVSVLAQPEGFASLDVGDRFACGSSASGEVYCWGDGLRELLSEGDHALPTQLETSEPLEGLTLGEELLCGVGAQTRSAFCISSSESSLDFEGLEGTWRTLSAGKEALCGIRTSGDVVCVGDVESEGATEPSPEEQLVDARDLEVTALSLRSRHGCILTAEGRALCWGHNSSGQLGDGSEEDRSTPAPVLGNMRWKSVATGRSNTCAIANTDMLYCWGSYESSILSAETSNITTPTRMTMKWE